MERVYDDAINLLEREIEEITSKNELSPSTLEVMYKATDIIKDIETICAMRKVDDWNEYSGKMPYYMYEDEGMSTARGRGRYAKRDSMGRYASRGSYDGYGRSYDGYSRDEDYERMMRDASTEKERELIRQLMEAKNHN